MRNSGPVPVRSVSVTIDGVTHHGAYFVQRSTVYVRSPLGDKAIQVGGAEPVSIARLLLLELVRGAQASPRLD
jgi:hypothetical protein